MTQAAIPGPGKQFKYYGLDHLRALAITLVLFYHYRMFNHPEWIDDTLGFGWTGVDLFFVLSGYLISAPLLAKIKHGKPISLPQFFIKRFFRIIPAYLVVLSIYFCFPAFWERPSLPPLWKFLTFTQNFGFDIKNYGTFSHVWSLCVEEHFYLFFPLVIITLLHFKQQRKGDYLLAALFIAGFVARLYSWYVQILPDMGNETFGITWYKYMYYPTYNRLDGLLMGVLIAALFTFKPAVKSWVARHGNLTALFGLLVLTCAYFLCMDQHSFYASIFGYPVVALGYGLWVASAVSPSCFLYKFKSSFTSLIAKLSFALYLSHKGVIHLVQPLLAKTGIAPKGNVMLLLCLLTAVIAAWILNRIVEAPFLALRDRILRKQNILQPAIQEKELVQ